MNYEEAVEYINSTPKFTTKNKLEHTKECLARLGNPQDRFRVIHVAGTNGKGSNCAFLTSILREAGYSCGLFTSPHLVDIKERFQINEVMIDNDTFLDAFHRVKKLADELVEEG
ncbi:MAG: bifunctional folylpolyglutamate synthase/dihydrofolate synthase, partial [Clostridiales bacterium]|nr:bifunctional folylpolyglutamate synthase/dihydrofolate synthase [Candidatus Blautia equi]